MSKDILTPNRTQSELNFTALDIPATTIGNTANNDIKKEEI